jgi:transcription elongation factor Elf1
MECPICESEIIVLHSDPIECTDCGATMNIEYCVCPECHYSFRMINGEFLDEMQMDSDSLDEVVEDLENLLDDDYETVWAAESHLGSLLDLIHPCVKCGETMTVYDEDRNEYECLNCGFRWEILSNE